MRVDRLYAGSYAANSYLLRDDAGEGAVLFDPAISVSAARAVLGELPRIDLLVLTHGHFDHMLALEEWRQYTGAPLAVSEQDAPALTDADRSCYRFFLGRTDTFAPAEVLLSEGDTVPVGREEMRVLLLPGHTAGSIVLDGGGLLLTGDTLFADGGYGRTDLPSGDAASLICSLRRLLSLPGERRILSGHGRETTMTEAKNDFYYLV